jgi:hypothetical protein
VTLCRMGIAHHNVTCSGGRCPPYQVWSKRPITGRLTTSQRSRTTITPAIATTPRKVKPKIRGMASIDITLQPAGGGPGFLEAACGCTPNIDARGDAAGEFRGPAV